MKRVLFAIMVVLLLRPTGSLLAGAAERDLLNQGLHVAELWDSDRLNLQLDKLEQAIRAQSVPEIQGMLAADYRESGPPVARTVFTEELQTMFSNLSSARQFPTETNFETGWTVTSSHDFYIRILRTEIQSDRAWVECEIGLSQAGKRFNGIGERLGFVVNNGSWFLEESQNLFGWLRSASQATTEEIGMLSFDDRVLRQTKDDFSSSHLLVPVTFYNYGKTAIPRFNKTESQYWFGVNCMNSPFGIVVDVEDWPGSSNLDHSFLFVSDVTSNKIIGTDQDDWVAEFGSQGSGVGQFWGPHGMCTVQGYYYFVADMFNNRVIGYRYYNQLEEPLFYDSLTISGYPYHNPRDVEAKDRNPYDQQDATYLAVADEGNHRIVLFHWEPWTLGWDRNYGEYGSGEGQFMWPTSVCFGRDPESGYQTDDLYITDYGNRRLVRIYINRPEGVNWRGTYEFPEGTELTSVEVDNKGLVYVVDRHYGKVYKFAPSETYPYYFKLLGIWGQTGTEDGQLYHPNSIQVAHGRYVPHPNPGWSPLRDLGDVFISESWGDETGVRRFVIAADVLNLTADWVPYNESTGEGNFIWWEYHLTDCGTVTEQVLRGAEVCTTYNRGSLNYGPQGGAWPVDGHPHGTYYTVKVSATSIYDPTIVIEKTVDVYVDTLSTHAPVITQGIRCNWKDTVGVLCNECWHCLREWQEYTLDVQAYHPDGYPLSYVWNCGRGHFYIDDWISCNPCTTETNEICYSAPQAPTDKGDRPYEFIRVTVRDPYGSSKRTSIYTNSIFESGTSCLCGDANNVNGVEGGDIVYLITYLFRGGAPPPDPIERGDANNDCVISGADVNYLIEYVYREGDPPECCWIHEPSE